MRISDMLGQYNKNITSNSSEELQSAQSSGKMVSTLGELETGTIFEGTVSNMRNGRVTLALSNGQMISARLDGKINLNSGDSMFFQVRSNDGTTVSIKPYTTESGVNNPILLNALTAAGVPATERSVAMVDAMMKEQMSIGKQSILDMIRVLNRNPDVKVSTLVQMTKIGLPISIESAAQFENYRADNYAIMGEVDAAIDQLLSSFGQEGMQSEDAFLLYSNVLDIVTGDGMEDVIALMEKNASSVLQEQTGEGSPAIQPKMGEEHAAESPVIQPRMGEEYTAEFSVTQSKMGEEHAAETAARPQAGENTPEILQQIQESTEKAQRTAELELLQSRDGVFTEHIDGQTQTIEQLLNNQQITHLKHLLQNIPTLTGNTDLFVPSEEVFADTMSEEIPASAKQLAEELPMGFREAEFRKDMTAEKFLHTVRDAIAQNSQYGFSGTTKLFCSKEFQTLLRNVIEQQWTIKPQELVDGKKINQFYEKMERQLKQLDHAMQMTGVSENGFSASAAQVRGNIEFMNQMNQIYTYVQLPLKLTGQNVSGELYVYTNKKNLKDPDAELTAFLHLDLENLGTTDVSVKMLRKNVGTKFYMDNDTSYDLLKKHLPILEKRLQKRGYTCRITITNEAKKMDFVNDFLERDLPPAGTLRRYSFDMKA